MSIIIYHKNLKRLTCNKFNKKETKEYFFKLGNDLVISGFKMNRGIAEQIKVYQIFVDKIQSKKIYKITIEDIDYYNMCVLALWRLGVYDPEDATSPIYISPTRKTSRRKTALR